MVVSIRYNNNDHEFANDEAIKQKIEDDCQKKTFVNNAKHKRIYLENIATEIDYDHNGTGYLEFHN